MSLLIFSKRLREQCGTALIIALLILIVLSVIGVYAVFTSSVDTRIAGNERLMEIAFYAADGGTDYGRRTIELVLNNQALPTGSNPSDEDAFRDEIRGFDTSGSPYVVPVIGGWNTQINVDRIKAEYVTGGSAEFGEGGTGKLAAYYQVDSSSSGTDNTSSRVRTTYRRMLP